VFAGDLKQEATAQAVVQETLNNLGKIDILVNNHAVQYVRKSILDISAEQLDETFRTNIYAYFFMTKAALPHLKKGASIINTTSVTAYHGNKELIDYSSTKGAIVAFTRSLSLSLTDQGIRVNGVAPGPIWTPLIPSSFSAQDVEKFGAEAKSDPMKHAGQPWQVAGCYVFLASDDASYMSGQILHPNGGTITGS
jgi:NAD(P)-dependent dehydrogenase (short-subunit alcohol dehydrogenase family)